MPLAAAVEAAENLELAGGIARRGADHASVAGTRVHSLRLSGYALSTDVIPATAGERLGVRHEAGASADPYG